MTEGQVIHPHPPGGRCMPNRCYCGGCPGYVPIRRDAAAVRAAVDDLLKKGNSAAHAKSWADRDEPTWLDK